MVRGELTPPLVALRDITLINSPCANEIVVAVLLTFSIFRPLKAAHVELLFNLYRIVSPSNQAEIIV